MNDGDVPERGIWLEDIPTYYATPTTTTGFVSVGTIIESRAPMTLGESAYSQILRPQIKEKPKPKRRAIGLKKRFEILKRDGFKCVYCGNKAGKRPLHVDHVIPVSKGGENTDDNLAAACFECNMGKKADIHEGLTEHVFGTKKKEPCQLEQYKDSKLALKRGSIILRDADTGIIVNSSSTNLHFGTHEEFIGKKEGA